MNKRVVFAIALTVIVLALAACQPETVEVTRVVTETVEVEGEQVEVTRMVTEQVEVTRVVESDEAEEEGPVTISFWHSYNEVEMEKLENDVIPAFEDANPGVTVESVNVPYDEFRRKLLTAIAGGTAPDLIRSDIIWVPEFADMGALVPLDEQMADFDEYASAVFEAPLATNFLNGHYYGLPLDTNTRVLVYNTAMFEEAGIEAPPATMEEFVAACEQIKALGEDVYCFADGGTYAWAVNPWIWSFGGAVTDEEITAAIDYLNGEQTQAAYEHLKMLVDEGYMHPGILGEGVDAWGAFGSDQVAMLLEGPWFGPLFGSSFPDKEYGYALMPEGPGGSVSVVGGEDIIMFQQSQHKEEAADFIRHMLSEETQMALVEVGQVPVLNSSLETDTIQNHDFFPIFLEQLETARARTPHPNWTQMEEILTNAGAAYLRGEQSFSEAFDVAAEEIDPLLLLPE
ncbi:MAG: extracellular solute-binding protein [Chloroflexota bacterium]